MHSTEHLLYGIRFPHLGASALLLGLFVGLFLGEGLFLLGLFRLASGHLFSADACHDKTKNKNELEVRDERNFKGKKPMP